MAYQQKNLLSRIKLHYFLLLLIILVCKTTYGCEPLIEQFNSAGTSCSIPCNAEYLIFACTNPTENAKGCAVWKSLYRASAGSRYECFLHPLKTGVVVYNDPKLGYDGGDFTSWFIPVDPSPCPDGGTFNAKTLACTQRTVIIDPGHGLIEQKDGTFAYQREPSPVYGLIEDELTLQMAFKLKSLLEADGIKVFMLRGTSLAPYAPINCNVPCKKDLDKRREKAEMQLKDDEDEVMVSIHTNGAEFEHTKLINPAAHGTLSIYSPLSPQASSQALAELMSSHLSALGLKKLTLIHTEMAVLNGENLPSTLVEVAFHTNSFRQLGQAFTDEEFLHTSTDSAAFAMFQAIKDYYENQ